jgi:2-methylisocitrate lyase-like PEP mutase family enzyme
MSRKPNLLTLMASGPVVTPTAFDMVAAKVAAESGFDAVFCGGYGQAASALGLPDNGALTLDVQAQRVGAMSRSVSIPVLADGDTGFGDPASACRDLIEAGADAVMIEDQTVDKTCGHAEGKAVVSEEEMLVRLERCLSGRTGDVPIIARCDALQPLGLEEALRRGHSYLEAGADILFIEAPTTIEQLEAIAAEFDAPLMVDMMPGGVSPQLSVGELAELGYRLIVFGLVDMMLSTAALRAGLGELARTGDVRAMTSPLMPMAELHQLTGLA